MREKFYRGADEVHRDDSAHRVDITQAPHENSVHFFTIHQKQTDMSRTLLFLLFLAVFTRLVDGGSVRDGTTANCAGTTSCRPRCIGFRLDRTARTNQWCETHDGIFAAHRSEPVAWKLDEITLSAVCDDSASWKSDLDIVIRERGYAWEFSTELYLSSLKDRFTYCSSYPCPKDECALPEQMVSGADLSTFPPG